jgi:hypothetical protein
VVWWSGAPDQVLVGRPQVVHCHTCHQSTIVHPARIMARQSGLSGWMVRVGRGWAGVDDGGDQLVEPV